MKCKKITDRLDEMFPPMYAMDWDNIGLLEGDETADIKTVFVALDATKSTIGEAISKCADLIVTHHPMIFHPVSRVIAQDTVGQRILVMAEHRISCFAIHTNYDIVRMADQNAEELSLQNPEILSETYRDEAGVRAGLGRVGLLPVPLPLKKYAEKIRDIYSLPAVRFYGNPESIIRSAAVCSGSGKSCIGDALAKHADVLVTGDLDYHTSIDAVASGLSLIDAGHYGTEYGFISDMTKTLQNLFPELEVYSADIKEPYEVV